MLTDAGEQPMYGDLGPRRSPAWRLAGALARRAGARAGF
jgi:hypothetical protein